jgi:hypothetical protein
MAVVEDLAKGGRIPLLALGLLVVVPLAFPSLRPAWAGAIKTGAKLYFEAQGDVDDEIMDHLAQKAVDLIADAIAGYPPEERPEAVAGIVDSYSKKARARADRRGRDERGRKARYHRHLSRLRRKVLDRRATAGSKYQASWEKVAAGLQAPS